MLDVAVGVDHVAERVLPGVVAVVDRVVMENQRAGHCYGSTDLGSPSAGRTLTLYGKKQSQFALGGLVGYNFGPVITQFYLTRDVAESNYNGYDTRAWTRVIVPLWNPDALVPRKPLITK
jgi:hypothetical protein